MDGSVSFKDLGLAKLIGGMLELGAEEIRVGVVGEKAEQPSSDGRITIAEEVVINEYGLAPNAPARPFMREYLREHQGEISADLQHAVVRIVTARGDESAIHAALDAVGKKHADGMRDVVLSGHAGAPNSPSTVAKKGFDHPLFDSGGLADAIDHRVTTRTEDYAEVEFGEIGGDE